MRVLLINTHRSFNLGLAYVHAYLGTYLGENSDCEVRSLNLARSPNWQEEIASWQPDLVGISVNIFSLPTSIAVAKYCREATSALLVVGGPQVTLEGAAFLDHYPIFDCAVLGEGEVTFLEIVQAGAERSQLPVIAGLAYRDGTSVKVSGPRAPIANLDELPFIRPALFDKGRINFYPILSSRGCPYTCNFCPNAMIWSPKWRARSPENVVDEIALRCAEGADGVAFWDDVFNLDMKRAKAIFRGIVERGLKVRITFPNGVRIDRLDDELVSLMRDAGTVRVAFGLENVDPETMANVGKRLSIERAASGVALLKKYGFRPEAFMIIGLAGSDRASTFRSLQTVKEIGVELARWYLAQPYPGTQLQEWVEKHGRMAPEDVRIQAAGGSWHATPAVPFDTPDFPKHERLQAYYRVNADCDNFFFLYNHERSAPVNAVLGLGKILRYHPRKTFSYLRWLGDAWRNPHYAFFNEPAPVSS